MSNPVLQDGVAGLACTATAFAAVEVSASHEHAHISSLAVYSGCADWHRCMFVWHGPGQAGVPLPSCIQLWPAWQATIQYQHGSAR